jgi:hypothetical protein
MHGLLSFLAHRDQYYPINSVLVQHLDVLDLIRLTRVCKDLTTVYQDALKTQWNVNIYLKQYFDDPLRFRQIQADTGALISRRTAFNFFSRCHTDITEPFTIIVRAGDNADALTTFLQSQRYALAQDLEDAIYCPQFGLAKVRHSLRV